MALAALLAAATVSWFGRRMRLLAREAAVRGAEAERALAGMQRLAASRERLVRGVTHDLKNPLGAAEGYAQLLQEGIEGELAPGQARMVDGIRRCHASALALIQELLDFSRAESGSVELAREEVDCASVAREAAREYRASARVAGLELEVRLPEGPLACVTDRGRVLRIVGNLLSNAVKYTPAPGRVVLEGRRAGADGGGGWIEVCVRDTGPGIPPEERERIFDEFHRLEGNGAGGHGLGLATSRRIARLLGGDIAVGEAREGGAEFTLRLPLRAEEGGG
jgi:signal transduction histidine kinase